MSTTKQKPSPSDLPAAGSLEEWRHRSLIRDVVLPSGMVVDLRAVPLDELAALDGLPVEQQRVAFLHQGRAFEDTIAELTRGDDIEKAEQLLDDNRKLVNRIVRVAIAGPLGVVEGLAALDDDDPLEMIDPFDKEMIVEIAQRLRVFDANGRRVYGAQPLHTFPEADRKP